MGRDHGHPYILSTTVLSDQTLCIYDYFMFFLHIAAPAVLNKMPIQELMYMTTSFLKCEVDRGIPLAIIQWHIVNNETGQLSKITPNSHLRLKILEDGLEIDNTQLSDKGIYRCSVSNDYGTDSLDIQATSRGEYLEATILLLILHFVLYSLSTIHR